MLNGVREVTSSGDGMLICGRSEDMDLWWALGIV